MIPHRRLYDISVLTSASTPEWPGDTPFSCGWTWSMAAGASVNVSALTTSPHVGTHADAPLHVQDGWIPSDGLPLDVFRGPARVCTVTAAAEGRGDIDLDALPTLPAGPLTRLLLRTKRTIAEGSFPEWWPALSPSALTELLRRGLRLFGVDAPSVDSRDSTTLELHRLLFRGNAFNLENLDLRGVPDGEYELVALPVRIQGLDAAPVRAVLYELEQ